MGITKTGPALRVHPLISALIAASAAYVLSHSYLLQDYSPITLQYVS